MAFNLGDDNDNGMNEINLIPLIDIMLVLMIIFLVTATVLKPSIELTLPQTVAEVSEQKKEILLISIDKENQIFIEKQPLTLEQLSEKFASLSETEAQERPSINIRADKDATYNVIAKVLAQASKNKLTDIAFLSETDK